MAPRDVDRCCIEVISASGAQVARSGSGSHRRTREALGDRGEMWLQTRERIRTIAAQARMPHGRPAPATTAGASRY